MSHIVSGVLAVYIGIAVNADLIAEFTAEQLVQRHAVGFSGQIPQCNLNAGYAAALSGRAAELLDFAEYLIDIARVLS